MPLMRLLRFAYGALSLIIGEYSSIFEDTQENRQIDARMRRARQEAGHGESEYDERVTEGARAVEADDPLSNFSIPVPAAFKEWVYSSENWIQPYTESMLFYIDMIPVLFMCNLLARTAYAEYDEVTAELMCYNKAFEGFRLLWVDNGNTPITEVLDFSTYGYGNVNL